MKTHLKLLSLRSGMDNLDLVRKYKCREIRPIYHRNGWYFFKVGRNMHSWFEVDGHAFVLSTYLKTTESLFQDYLRNIEFLYRPVYIRYAKVLSDRIEQCSDDNTRPHLYYNLWRAEDRIYRREKRHFRH